MVNDFLFSKMYHFFSLDSVLFLYFKIKYKEFINMNPKEIFSAILDRNFK